MNWNMGIHEYMIVWLVCRDGKVRGETLRSDLGQEVDVWDRIPFAEPPVGELRLVQL